MPNLFTANWIDVGPGDPAFNVMSNMCNFFELGTSHSGDLWLMGEVVGDGEFVFNGRLFLRAGTEGTVVDNFPKTVPDGWSRQPAMNEEGYDLVDHDGEVIFGYRVGPDRICQVTVNLYKADGTIAAHGGQGGLILHGIDVTLGRGGVRLTA